MCVATLMYTGRSMLNYYNKFSKYTIVYNLSVCSFKHQLGTRTQKVDSLVLELKGQVAELNEQLGQRNKSLEDELVKREQLVRTLLYYL